MKKRILATMMVVCMSAGLFVSACGTKESGADSTETASTGTETTEISSESELEESAVTALSLMQEYNDGTWNVTDDNYGAYYEVFVYSFYDSDGDGIGDLAGLTEKLDYLNDGDDTTDTDLGIKGIWLMPIMPSTTYHKYDVTNYMDIDPEYGTMDDFKVFLEECHNRGINVIIDLVMNHSSSQHEWFKTACEYLQSLPEGTEPDLTECPYVDYYNFSKEKGGAYYEVSGTEWYYEGQFWSEMPDMNLASEAVRAEFESIVDYWLELGVDGFRLDAIKEFYTGVDSKNIEVLTWFNDMVTAKKEDVFIVGENWNGINSYAPYYESGISCFDFEFADSDGVIANTLKGTNSSGAMGYARNIINMQEMLSQYNPDYIDAPFYTNHDLGRSAGYYSGDNSPNQTKMAQAMNLLMSGSAFIYYGEELGMKGAGKDENKRAPMYWSMDASATGMCTGPKDMDNVKMKFESYEEQQLDGNSVYHFVKQTINLRNQYLPISHGIATFEEAVSSENICVLRKTYEGEEVLLVFNTSAEAQSVDLNSLNINGKAAAEMEIGGVLLTGTESIALENGVLATPAFSVTVIK